MVEIIFCKLAISFSSSSMDIFWKADMVFCFLVFGFWFLFFGFVFVFVFVFLGFGGVVCFCWW